MELFSLFLNRSSVRPARSKPMDDQLPLTINVLSYLAGAWIAFKTFDYRKKGKLPGSKDELMLWTLLLCFVLGAGPLIAYILKAWFVTD